MRIVLPLFAFWTAGVASETLVSDFRSGCKWNLRTVVFVIELPCLALAGVALALGNFGPNVAPLKFYSAASNLFNGGSVFTTMLFALFMREETEHLTKGVARRSIWPHHWRVILTSGLFFLFWDLLLLMVASFNINSAVIEAILVVTYVISIPFQIIIAVYFMSRTFHFRVQICMYLQIERRAWSSDFSEATASKLQRVGRLFLWLAISALCIFVATTTQSIFTFVLTSPSKTPLDVDSLFINVFLYSATRIGISFAQVSLCVKLYVFYV
jgi:phosphate starvation-inducible membrane PsiE